MLSQLFDWDPIILVHLQTLHHEETRLDARWLIKVYLIATIVDFGDQVFHLKTMEWCDADKHLIKHYTKRPCIDFRTIASLFEQLRA